MTLYERKQASARRIRAKKREEQGLPPRKAGDPTVFSNDYLISYYGSLESLNPAQSEQYQKAKLKKELKKEKDRLSQAKYRQRKREEKGKQVVVFKPEKPKKYVEVDYRSEEQKVMDKYIQHYNTFPGTDWLMATLNMFAWTDQGCDPELLQDLKANRERFGIKCKKLWQ